MASGVQTDPMRTTRSRTCAAGVERIQNTYYRERENAARVYIENNKVQTGIIQGYLSISLNCLWAREMKCELLMNKSRPFGKRTSVDKPPGTFKRAGEKEIESGRNYSFRPRVRRALRQSIKYWGRWPRKICFPPSSIIVIQLFFCFDRSLWMQTCKFHQRQTMIEWRIWPWNVR